jgi:hypothetical protein
MGAVKRIVKIAPAHKRLVIGFGRMLRQDVVRNEGGSHRVFLEKMKRGEGRWRRLWHKVSGARENPRWRIRWCDELSATLNLTSDPTASKISSG